MELHYQAPPAAIIVAVIVRSVLSSAEERRPLKANVLGYGPVCKTGETGSIPVRASKTPQWLERRGTDLLNRQMLVRIQSGAPLIFSRMPRSSWMSADFLHRKEARS